VSGLDRPYNSLYYRYRPLMYYQTKTYLIYPGFQGVAINLTIPTLWMSAVDNQYQTSAIISTAIDWYLVVTTISSCGVFLFVTAQFWGKYATIRVALSRAQLRNNIKNHFFELMQRTAIRHSGFLFDFLFDVRDDIRH